MDRSTHSHPQPFREQLVGWPLHTDTHMPGPPPPAARFPRKWTERRKPSPPNTKSATQKTVSVEDGSRRSPIPTASRPDTVLARHLEDRRVTRAASKTLGASSLQPRPRSNGHDSYVDRCATHRARTDEAMRSWLGIAPQARF